MTSSLSVTVSSTQSIKLPFATRVAELPRSQSFHNMALSAVKEGPSAVSVRVGIRHADVGRTVMHVRGRKTDATPARTRYSDIAKTGLMAPESRPGRRRSTTPQHITDVALRLFTAHGFDAVSVDDVAHAAGISRRTVFRYYASKNAIPWGDFDAHLQQLRNLLGQVHPAVPVREALRTALLAFNTFDESEMVRHRQRMRVILQTAELQAYSMTMYSGWREVIARFVARRFDTDTTDLLPQTVAWTMLGIALSAYEHWLDDESASLQHALGAAFDVVSTGLDRLNQ